MTYADRQPLMTSFTRRSALLSIGAVFATACTRSGATAQEDGARRLLKAMSDYMAGAKSIAATFDSTIEVVTPSLQKIQFASSGKLTLERPNRLRVERTGGYADATFIFDGKMLSIFEKDRNIYAQAAIAGSIDDMLNALHKDFSVEPPGADLLQANVYETLISSSTEAKQIGRGVIAGVECDHLAFRDDDVDWQIWIDSGAAPAPRKYVVTSKAVTGAPEYTLVIRDWRTGEQASSDAFNFVPPEGAKKVVLTDLRDIDEVPPARIDGEKK